MYIINSLKNYLYNRLDAKKDVIKHLFNISKRVAKTYSNLIIDN